MMHLWDLPGDLRITFNLEACRCLRAKLSENGWYQKAQHLYSPLGMDWSDRDRPGYNPHGHLRSLPVSSLEELSRKTKVPLDQLEGEITALFRSSSVRGNLGPFPIKVDENYAWLAGLWFSCGGFYARERQVRFRVERGVAEEVKRVAGNIGCQATISNYIQYEARLSRAIIILPGSMYEIFKKLGLPDEIKGFHASLRKGRNPAAREQDLTVPNFVKKEPRMRRAFVEGYMNGSKLAIWRYNKQVECFGKMVTAHVTGVDVRFVCPNRRQLFKFANFVIAVLRRASFKGTVHQITQRTGRNLNYGYTITKKDYIRTLFRDFKIVKPSAQRVLEG